MGTGKSRHALKGKPGKEKNRKRSRGIKTKNQVGKRREEYIVKSEKEKIGVVAS